MLEWRFLHPWFLALLPLPLIWLAWHYFSRGRRHPSVLYSSVAPFEAATRTLKIRVLKAMPLLRVLALMLGIVALARPQYGHVERSRASLGIDIALSLDISGSMDLPDFPPNRLEAAKTVIREFVEGRENDRLSVVVFGSTAAVLVPPTFDRHAIGNFIDTISSSLFAQDKRETAIGMGLALAVDKLAESDAKSKVVILLTDGENNAGRIEPLQAAKAARALGVRVYTIGVGSNSVIQVPSNIFGQTVTRPIEATLDDETLQKIADLTGGRYFRASNTDALREIYSEIDRMEKTEIEMNEYDDYDERFMMLWLPGLMLIGLEFLLRAFWLARLP